MPPPVDPYASLASISAQFNAMNIGPSSNNTSRSSSFSFKTSSHNNNNFNFNNSLSSNVSKLSHKNTLDDDVWGLTSSSTSHNNINANSSLTSNHANHTHFSSFLTEEEKRKRAEQEKADFELALRLSRAEEAKSKTSGFARVNHW